MSWTTVSRYFEDFQPGQVYDLGSVKVDEQEMLAYSARYDPQPFHVDPEAAVRSPFGGIIASGWYTASLFMRMYVDTLLHESSSEGSPGVESLRWRRPVRAGDVLTGQARVREVRPSERNPRRGTVLLDADLKNQNDEIVFTFTAYALFGRRPSA